MLRSATLVCIWLCLLWTLHAQPTLDKLYGSGVYNGNQLDVLVHGPTGTSVLFDAPGGLSQALMEQAWSFSDWQRVSIDTSPSGYLGFWYPFPELTLNPFFYTGSQSPDPSIYAGLDNDAIGDHLFDSQWLDIGVVKHCLSADRIYFAMRCMGTGYPVSSGLTYFAYMPVMVDPDADPEDDPIVFGLMQTVNVPGIISPGLYKITGTGFSGLTRIGDITSSVQGDFLVLSCALSDLVADPDFSSWFDPADPRVATVATTSRITLVNGIQQADITPGLDLLLRPQAMPVQNLYAPLLSAADVITDDENLMTPRITYFDQDANFPRIATYSIDGGEEHPLSPEEIGMEAFDAPVSFSGVSIPEPANWSDLRFRFSHGDSFVYHTLHHGSGIGDENQISSPMLSLTPNPAFYFINLKSSSEQPISYAIYNLKGQKMHELLLEGGSEFHLDTSAYPAGVYFLKPISRPGNVKRFVKI